MMEGMKDKGVIEESDSPWSSPVVIVRKNDCSLRFCIDYRKLNEATKNVFHSQRSMTSWTRWLEPSGSVH